MEFDWSERSCVSASDFQLFAGDMLPILSFIILVLPHTRRPGEMSISKATLHREYKRYIKYRIPIALASVMRSFASAA